MNAIVNAVQKFFDIDDIKEHVKLGFVDHAAYIIKAMKSVLLDPRPTPAILALFEIWKMVGFI